MKTLYSMIVAALPMLLAGLLVMPNAALSADSPAPTLTVVAFGDSLTAGYLL